MFCIKATPSLQPKVGEISDPARWESSSNARLRQHHWDKSPLRQKRSTFPNRSPSFSLRFPWEQRGGEIGLKKNLQQGQFIYEEMKSSTLFSSTPPLLTLAIFLFEAGNTPCSLPESRRKGDNSCRVEGMLLGKGEFGMPAQEVLNWSQDQFKKHHWCSSKTAKTVQTISQPHPHYSPTLN